MYNEKDLIKVGIIACQTWDIKFPPSIEFSYSPSPYIIEKIKPDKITNRPSVTAEIDSDIVTFRCVRDFEGMNVWMGYSKKFNTLVISK